MHRDVTFHPQTSAFGSAACNDVTAAPSLSNVTLMRPPTPAAPATPSRRGGVCVLAPLAAAALALAGCAHHDYARYEPRPLDPAKTAAALEARTLDDPGLRKFLRENFRADFPLTGAPEGGWDFEALCWVAFYFNPALDVARAQWESARAVQKTAAERPNPTVTLTPGFSANPNGASPWLPAIGLDFAIDPAAQRDRRAEVARLNAEAARQAVFATAWKVRSDLRQALADLAFANLRFEKLAPQVDTSRRILSLLEQRLAAGAATNADVANARLALIKAEAVAADAASQIAPTRQRVSQAIGIPDSAIAATNLAKFRQKAHFIYSPESMAEARRESLQIRADVIGALARYAVAESTVALEVERQHPGVHLGPGYQWDQGQNKWTVAFTFELPLFNHNEGPLAEAEARRHEAAAQLAAAQAQVLAELDSALAAQIAAEAQDASLRQFQQELQTQRQMVEARLQAGGADQLELENAKLEYAVGIQALAEASYKSYQAHELLDEVLHEFHPNLSALAPPERVATKPVSQQSP